MQRTLLTSGMLAVGMFSGLLGLTGCTASMPTPTHYSSTTQQEMLSVYHWDVLADHLAKQLKQTLDGTFTDGNVKPAVFIRYTEAMEKIPFSNVFQAQLRTRLMQQGIPVITQTSYPDTLIMEFDAQVIEHNTPYAETWLNRRACFDCVADMPYGEVAITSSVTMGQQFIFSSHDAYYVRAVDFDWFRKHGKVYQVVNR